MASFSERVNFYKACRVLFDNATKALKEACENEFKLHSYPANRAELEDLKRLDFSRLADHLVTPKRTKTKPGSFYFKGFSAKIGSTDPKDSYNFLDVVRDVDGRLNHIDYSADVKVSVNEQLSSIERRSDKEFKLCRHLSDKEKRSEIDVYFQTKQCIDLYKLKTLRNDLVGHPKEMSITDEELTKIFGTAKEAYCSLGVLTDEIKRELHDIQEEKLMDEKKLDQMLDEYSRQLDEYSREYSRQLKEIKEDLQCINSQVMENQEDIQLIKSEGVKVLGQLNHHEDRIEALEKQQENSQLQMHLPHFIVTGNRMVFKQQMLVSQPCVGNNLIQQRLAIQNHPSSATQVLPGQPTEEEINRLAEKLDQHYMERPDKGVTDICRMLSISCEKESTVSMKEYIKCVLNQWIKKDQDNDRQKLKELLKKGRLSSFTNCLSTRSSMETD